MPLVPESIGELPVGQMAPKLLLAWLLMSCFEERSERRGVSNGLRAVKFLIFHAGNPAKIVCDAQE